MNTGDSLGERELEPNKTTTEKELDSSGIFSLRIYFIKTKLLANAGRLLRKADKKCFGICIVNKSMLPPEVVCTTAPGPVAAPLSGLHIADDI